MSQGVEGKVPDVSILQQVVVVILEGFLLEVVTKFVGNDETIVGVLIPCPNFVLRLLLFPAGKLVLRRLSRQQEMLIQFTLD